MPVSTRSQPRGLRLLPIIGVRNASRADVDHVARAARSGRASVDRWSGVEHEVPRVHRACRSVRSFWIVRGPSKAASIPPIMSPISLPAGGCGSIGSAVRDARGCRSSTRSRASPRRLGLIARSAVAIAGPRDPGAVLLAVEQVLEHPRARRLGGLWKPQLGPELEAPERRHVEHRVRGSAAVPIRLPRLLDDHLVDAELGHDLEHHRVEDAQAAHRHDHRVQPVLGRDAADRRRAGDDPLRA